MRQKITKKRVKPKKKLDKLRTKSKEKSDKLRKVLRKRPEDKDESAQGSDFEVVSVAQGCASYRVVVT